MLLNINVYTYVHKFGAKYCYLMCTKIVIFNLLKINWKVVQCSTARRRRIPSPFRAGPDSEKIRGPGINIQNNPGECCTSRIIAHTSHIQKPK